MSPKKYDLEGSEAIAEHFGVALDTLVIDWRRFEPPVPLHSKNAVLCADSKEVTAWIEQMGIKTREH